MTTSVRTENSHRLQHRTWSQCPSATTCLLHKLLVERLEGMPIADHQVCSYQFGRLTQRLMRLLMSSTARPVEKGSCDSSLNVSCLNGPGDADGARSRESRPRIKSKPSAAAQSPPGPQRPMLAWSWKRIRIPMNRFRQYWLPACLTQLQKAPRTISYRFPLRFELWLRWWM